jgi:hypothetical protein
MVWMRKFATPELKRVAPAMKSAEKGFFHHSKPVREIFQRKDAKAPRRKVLTRITQIITNSNALTRRAEIR